MVDVRVDPSDEAVTVEVIGELTNDTVEDVRGQFEAALAFNRPLTLSVDQVSSFDLTGIQLCLALRRDAESREIPVSYSGEETVDRMRRMLSFAGLPEL